MKKVWTLVAVIMFACACALGGCSGASSQGASSSASAASEQAASASADATAEPAVSASADAASEPSASANADAAAESGVVAGIDFTSGTPWVASSIEGAITESTETNLKDDFALAVNKDVILALEIPAGQYSAGTVSGTEYQLEEDLIAMLHQERPASHDTRLVYDMYEMLMDWDARNAVGVEPLKRDLESIEGISSIDEMDDYLIGNLGAFLYDYYHLSPRQSTLWSCTTLPDLDDSSTNLPVIAEGAFLLGDAAEYTSETELGAARRQVKSDLVCKMLVKAGYSQEEAAQKVENRLALEAKTAPFAFTEEQKASPDYKALTNNHFTREALEEIQGPLPITDVCDAMGFPQDKGYRVYEPEYLKALASLYTQDNLALLKDYYIVGKASEMTYYLDREAYDWQTESYAALYGVSGSVDDEVDAVFTLQYMLPWPTARLYADTFLKQEDKERLSKLVDEIKAEFHGILNEAEFLSEETRANAIAKLDAMRSNVLYPDDWTPYSYEGFDLVPAAEGGTVYDNLNAAKAFAMKKTAARACEPADRNYWYLTPDIVNCEEGMQANCINILGAFAKAGLYNSAMSDEEVYAKMGVVIAHEISHNFDQVGAQFDKTGTMASWWTEADYAAFQEKNAKLAAYFDAIHPWEGQDLNGTNVAGEACADMGGVKCMLRIAAKKEGFDYDKFFRDYADLWLEKLTQQFALVIVSDVHPFGYLRINTTLQQFDEFQQLYGIEPGDLMYLAPEDRVTVW